jgi:hypothetical protein
MDYVKGLGHGSVRGESLSRAIVKYGCTSPEILGNNLEIVTEIEDCVTVS